MRHRRHIPRSLIATALLLLPISGQGRAIADEADFRVQVGAIHPSNPSAPYEYTRFYPEQLKIHRGQTVRWDTAWTQFSGFHTITFAEAGRPALLRPDDIPGTYATPEAWAFGGDCGRGSQPACVLTEGTQFISSGTPPFGSSPFLVTIDAPVGNYGYFCTVHPAMAGEIQVVPDSEDLPTPAEIEQTVDDEVAADSADADTVFASGQTPVSQIEDGQRVWQVRVGDSTANDHVSILAYLPTDLQIDAGDKVRYVYRPGIVNEIHTVTFPSAIVGSFVPIPHGLGGFGFYPSCDPDDPATGAKGIPGTWGIAGPDCPGSLELAVSPWMTTAHPAPGNIVGTPATYHDSGLLVPPGAPASFRTLPDTGRELPATFEAEFPVAGSFSFECNVHVDPMTGGVAVS